jgi:hypothetical protein
MGSFFPEKNQRPKISRATVPLGIIYFAAFVLSLSPTFLRQVYFVNPFFHAL